MTSTWFARLGGFWLFWVCPSAALAHSFGQVYNLPVPFWLYAWGATGALLASFVMVAVALTSARATQAPAYLAWAPAGPRTRALLRLTQRSAQAIALGLMLLCIATGLWGVNSPYGNFNLTAFWIVFVLGLTYVVALTGNLYARVNPWRSLTDLGVAAITVLRADRTPSPWLRYPAWLGHWPAVAQYMAFIWIELNARHTPQALAEVLLVYTALTLGGCLLFGRQAWFRQADVFAVFFRQVARLAPLQPDPDRPGGLRLYWPMLAVAQRPAESLSVLVFILFMLSSTAFDGLSDTLAWRRWLWADLYNAGLKHWVGTNPLAAFPQMQQIDRVWRSVWLLASPWLYLAVYLAIIALTRRLTRSAHNTRTLALAFAPTLLPIALAYHFTHYYTLLQTQGVKILPLMSDPFGHGWDLFGTADWLQRTIIPNPGTVWHVQVVLIVLGHVISVYLAHRVALLYFPSRRQAAISQLPMLLLMIALTIGGLWILSQPLASGG